MNAYFPLSFHYLRAILDTGTLYPAFVQWILDGKVPQGVDVSLFAGGMMNSEQAHLLGVRQRNCLDEYVKELADGALERADADFFDELRRLDVKSSRGIAFLYCKKVKGEEEVKKLGEMLSKVYVVLSEVKAHAWRRRKEKIILEVATEKQVEFLSGFGRVVVEEEVPIERWKRLYVSDAKKVRNAVRSAGVENLEVCGY